MLFIYFAYDVEKLLSGDSLVKTKIKIEKSELGVKKSFKTSVFVWFRFKIN